MFSKACSSTNKSPSHHSFTLFKFARERAEDGIQKCRLRLIEVANFDLQPQRYDPHSGSFAQFDNDTKEKRVQDLRRWIAWYEAVARFCLKMEAMISEWEAEEFGKQIAEMFRRQAK